jgi:hypothetical protein
MARNRRILFALLSLALVGGGCDHDHCESLRDELTDFKDAWSTCETDYDCIKIGGNGKDCTGILSCDLAVHRASRLEAERRIASLPEETQDCIECTSPNCVSGDLAVCEPVSQRCILVTPIEEEEQ